MLFKTVDISGNAKLGPMSAFMSQSKTCPNACPLKDGGCYARFSFVGMQWRKLDQQAKPEGNYVDVAGLARWIRTRATNVFRAFVAGDLPGDGETIDAEACDKIGRATVGKTAIAFSHYPPTAHNVRVMQWLIGKGFVVNASANNLKHADQLADKGLPVATLLPEGARGKIETPAGRRVVVCPAVTHDAVTCSTCKLCTRANREVIVGFPAHGSAKRETSRHAMG